MTKQISKETEVTITKDGRILVKDTEVNEHDAEEFLRNYHGIKTAAKNKRKNLDKNLRSVRQNALDEIKGLNKAVKLMKNHISEVKLIREEQIKKTKEEIAKQIAKQ